MCACECGGALRWTFLGRQTLSYVPATGRDRPRMVQVSVTSYMLTQVNELMKSVHLFYTITCLDLTVGGVVLNETL